MEITFAEEVKRAHCLVGGGASKVGLNAVIQARRHSKSLSGDAPPRKAPGAEGKIYKIKNWGAMHGSWMCQLALRV